MSKENLKKKQSVSRIHRWLLHNPAADEIENVRNAKAFEKLERAQNPVLVRMPILRKKKANDDMSKTYRRKEILYYKSHPKAEPKVLAVNGYAVWHYNEFVSDIEFEGKRCRVFYNPYNKNFIVNEIVESDGERILLKNPAYDEEKTKLILSVFFDGKTPENKLRNTARVIKTKMDALIKSQTKPSKLKSKSKGRGKDQYLRDATYYAIMSRKPDKDSEKLTIDDINRAYEIYKDKATSKIAFRTALYRLGNEVWAAWNEKKRLLGDAKRSHTTQERFAKKYLKSSQNLDKQRTRGITE